MRLAASLSAAAATLLFALSAAAQRDPIGDDDELRTVPVLRLALGPSLNFTPDAHAEVAMEATLGLSALQGIDGGVALNAEGGYMFASGEDDGSFNAGHLTLGIGWGALGMAITYQPRFIIGSYADDLAIGMRNGVTLHLLADLASIEVGHQFVSTRDVGTPDARELRHDVRMMLGLNPAAAVYLLTEAVDAIN